MGLRYYANAPATTLASSCTSGATSIVVTSVAGFPVQYPFTLIVDRGLATEEIVSVTAAAGTTLTVTRGYDSSTAFAHASAAPVVHGFSAIDPREANAHVNATGAVHGLTGSIVGTTDTQTLTNKTLTSPKIAVILGSTGVTALSVSSVASAVNYIDTVNAIAGSSPGLSAAGSDTNINLNLVPKGTGTVKINTADVVTVTGVQTLTNKTIALGSNTVSGTKAQFDTACTDADFASLAGTETLTNKTLSTGTIVGAGTDISGAWTAFTSTLTNVTLGTGGTNVGAYVQIGKTIHFRITVTLGTGGALTGNMTATVPVNAHAALVLTGATSIGGGIRDASPAAVYPIFPEFASASTLTIRTSPTTAGATMVGVNATVPITFAASDVISIQGTYEAA